MLAALINRSKGPTGVQLQYCQGDVFVIVTFEIQSSEDYLKATAYLRKARLQVSKGQSIDQRVSWEFNYNIAEVMYHLTLTNVM